MCIIIDANVRDKFFGKPIDPNAAPVMDWIVLSDGKMVVGGRLLRELEERATRVNFLPNLSGRERHFGVRTSQIDREEQELVKLHRCN